VLRLVRERTSAIAAGAVLLVPSLALLAGDYPWESWVTDGAGLVLGATGVALVFAGVAGRRPDWVD
jgi:hypothetical protein